jgi:hypothetical protein
MGLALFFSQTKPTLVYAQEDSSFCHSRSVFERESSF